MAEKKMSLEALLLQQIELQKQLIEAQQKVIELQAKIDEMTPKNAPDEELHWHIASGGMTSTAAAESENLETVKKFRDWNVSFAKKHIKPYVNPKVYGECLNQMTRGLSDRIAELETKKHQQKVVGGSIGNHRAVDEPPKMIQLYLMEQG